jgi:GTPase SAR1 family protein
MKEAVRDSHACLLVYDVSSRASLNNMLGFHNDIQHELSAARSRWRYISGFPRYHFDCKKKPVFVLANKVDLPTTSRAVTECEGRAFAASIGAKYCETSVKEDIGITEAIHTAITCALIHCAEIEIPELKEAEAKRFNERMKASKARMKEIYPYTYFLRRCRLDDTARGDTRALKLPRRRLLEMKSSAKRRR